MCQASCEAVKEEIPSMEHHFTSGTSSYFDFFPFSIIILLVPRTGELYICNKNFPADSNNMSWSNEVRIL